MRSYEYRSNQRKRRRHIVGCRRRNTAAKEPPSFALLLFNSFVLRVKKMKIREQRMVVNAS
jgi:hypothetical protein